MPTETTTTRLATLKAQAAKSYAQKDYSAASDFYAQACELQSSIDGDDNPQNAHLLYLYGRSLFQVALTKSDVLGGKPAEEQDEKEKKGGKGKGKGKDASKVEGEGEDGKLKSPAPGVGAKGGFFSFTGDENWDDSEEEGEGADAEEEDADAEKEGDDFTLAWEILDFARVLFLKQLGPSAPSDESTGGETTSAEVADVPTTGTDESKPIVQETTTDTSDDPITSVPNPDSAPPTTSTSAEIKKPDIKTLQTTLADTYDLLGEVSLESESFPQAAKDLRSSLELKLGLYPPASTLISEAHFKLSLALEFAAAGEDVTDDHRRKGREEAAVQMELAIASCRARIAKEEAELKELSADGDKDGKAKKSLEEAREMVGELEVRLADLRSATPPPTLADVQDDDQLQGILGQILSEDPEEARKRIAEVVGRANDLSGLVRKKPVSAPAEPATAAAGTTTVVVPTNGGKRKLEDVVEEEPVEELEIPKKVKLQDEAKPETEAEVEEKVEAGAEVKP